MLEQPTLSRATPIALAALALAVIVVDILLVVTLARTPIGPLTVGLGLLLLLSAPVLLVLGYWLWGLLSLRYALDRNSLAITFAGSTHIIPTPRITTVIPGGELQAMTVQGLRWPGLTIGQAEAPGVGRTLVFATRPQAEQVVVVTPDGSYAISPRNPAQFIEEVKTRQRLGPTEYLAQTVRTTPLLALAVWRDRLALGLVGVAGVMCLALFAWVALRYQALPAELVLRGALLPRGAALVLPLIGGAALAVNSVMAALVHERERPAALIALGGAVAAQAFLWVAALRAL